NSKRPSSSPDGDQIGGEIFDLKKIDGVYINDPDIHCDRDHCFFLHTCLLQ
nr:hypothetical protein [Tanacetum cinerariifolium]